jgi:hypothetical protein
VFAVPCNGQCLNVGRLGMSQKQVRPRHFSPPLQANPNHNGVPDPKYYLVRFKPPADDQFGISGSRCSMDIVSSEYSSATICLQSRDGSYFTTSTESSGLTSGDNSPWEHRLERAIVELNDEGEHQVEQVAVLSREVEANNVTDGFDGFGLFTPPG